MSVIEEVIPVVYPFLLNLVLLLDIFFTLRFNLIEVGSVQGDESCEVMTFFKALSTKYVILVLLLTEKQDLLEILKRKCIVFSFPLIINFKSKGLLARIAPRFKL